MASFIFIVIRIHRPLLRLHTPIHLQEARLEDRLEEAVELPWVRI